MTSDTASYLRLCRSVGTYAHAGLGACFSRRAARGLTGAFSSLSVWLRFGAISLCLFAAVLQAGSVQLTWDGVPTATSYRVWLSSGTAPFAPIWSGSTNSAVWSFTATNVQRFYVTALNVAGESGPSNIVTNIPPLTQPPPPPPIQTNTAPLAPLELRAQQVQGNRVDLVWRSDLTAATKVWRSVENDAFVEIGIVSAGIQHATTRIDKRRLYVFKVQSINQWGASDFSNDVIISSQ